MKRRVALVVSFDGTRYSGWQRQADADTIQGRLEQSLSKVCQHPVTLIGCSRTDAGVHARAHVSHFDTDASIPTERLPLALRSLLPDDIVVRSATEVPATFHARFQAQSKIYTYTIWNGPTKDPFWQRYSAFVPRSLDLELMKAAVPALVGKQDFKAFQAAGSTVRTTVRQIYHASVVELPLPGSILEQAYGGQAGSSLPVAAEPQTDRLLQLIVHGSGFLYNMMRIIAGTLVYIGEGKIGAGDIPSIIASRDRVLAGKTMPAGGLMLEQVRY